MPASGRVAVFAATSWEINAVLAAFAGWSRRMVNGVHVFSVPELSEREFWVARTGVGLEKASRVASRLLQEQPFRLVVSTGFACALIPAHIGDLVAGHAVTSMRAQASEFTRVVSVAGADQNWLFLFAKTVIPSDRIGTFLSVDRIIGHAAEKQHYARLTGAIALDMESGALAMAAADVQVPFLIVRSVSDLVEEELPLDFNLFLRPTGWFKGIAAIVAMPSRLMGLGRLRRQSVTAASSLTTFFQHCLSVTTIPANRHASAS